MKKVKRNGEITEECSNHNQCEFVGFCTMAEFCDKSVRPRPTAVEDYNDRVKNHNRRVFFNEFLRKGFTEK